MTRQVITLKELNVFLAALTGAIVVVICLVACSKLVERRSGIETCNGVVTLHYSERMTVIGDHGCLRIEQAPEFVTYSPALLHH